MYVGYPDIISADQGPQFPSKFWRDATKMVGTQLKLSGVESHNAINVGETYHELLRRIFNKAREDHGELSDEEVLALSTKALNDTTGPQGLVLTLLVFGILPRIPFVPTELPTQVERMKAMDAARTEVGKLVAESRLKLTLKANAPGSASTYEDIKIGSDVLVYREKPVKKWVGPFTVLDVHGKACHLDVNGKQSKFSIDKVKLYHEPPDDEVESPLHDDSVSPGTDETVTEPSATTGADVAHTQLDEDPIASASLNPLDDDDVVDRWANKFLNLESAEKDSQDLEDMRLGQSLPEDLFADDPADIHITKVLPPNDPREEGTEFDEARDEEVKGIKKRNVWDILSKDTIPSQ